MSLGYGAGTTTAAATQESDESYKKIIPNKTHPIPDIGAGRLYFRITRPAPEEMLHGMEFWLNAGVRRDGEPIAIPRISPNPFEDFLVVNPRTQARFVSRSAADKGCPLSALADQKHPVIALSRFKTDDQGNHKPNVEPFHAMFVQVIQPKRDGQGKPLLQNGKPVFDILPEELVLKMRQAWWDQWVNLVEPPEQQAAADDGMVDQTATQPQGLPDALKSKMDKVVWYIEKRRRTKNATGNVKMDVDYVIGFSEKVVLTDADIPKKYEEIESFDVMFQKPNKEELDELVAKAEARERGEDPQGSANAADAGEEVPGTDGGEEVPMDQPSASPSPEDPGAYDKSDDAGF